MKVIITSKEFEKEFLRLMSFYKEYYWAVAWANDKSKCFSELKKNKEKISKIIIGLHFYQTHPNFIQEFLNEPNIKFIKQTEGVFHSKIYLFKNHDDDWQVIIGSGNLQMQLLH